MLTSFLPLSDIITLNHTSRAIYHLNSFCIVMIREHERLLKSKIKLLELKPEAQKELENILPKLEEAKKYEPLRHEDLRTLLVYN